MSESGWVFQTCQRPSNSNLALFILIFLSPSASPSPRNHNAQVYEPLLFLLWLFPAGWSVLVVCYQVPPCLGNIDFKSSLAGLSGQPLDHLVVAIVEGCHQQNWDLPVALSKSTIGLLCHPSLSIAQTSQPQYERLVVREDSPAWLPSSPQKDQFSTVDDRLDQFSYNCCMSSISLFGVTWCSISLHTTPLFYTVKYLFKIYKDDMSVPFNGLLIQSIAIWSVQDFFWRIPSCSLPAVHPLLFSPSPGWPFVLERVMVIS